MLKDRLVHISTRLLRLGFASKEPSTTPPSLKSLPPRSERVVKEWDVVGDVRDCMRRLCELELLYDDTNPIRRAALLRVLEETEPSRKVEG